MIQGEGLCAFPAAMHTIGQPITDPPCKVDLWACNLSRLVEVYCSAHGILGRLPMAEARELRDAHTGSKVPSLGDPTRATAAASSGPTPPGRCGVPGGGAASAANMGDAVAWQAIRRSTTTEGAPV